MNLETVKLACAVVTFIGLALAIITARVVWVDKVRVDRHGDEPRRVFSHIIFRSKLDTLVIQSILFYVRVLSASTVSPDEPAARSLQYQGAILMGWISLILANRSCRYLMGRRKILSYF